MEDRNFYRGWPSTNDVTTLRASCGEVYCNRPCLWVCGCVCLWIYYHDNLKGYLSEKYRHGVRVRAGVRVTPGLGLGLGSASNFGICTTTFG